MKKRIMSIILTVASLCFFALPVSAEETSKANNYEQTEQSVKHTVTVYTTNDIHGVVENSDTAIGMAQTAGIAASTENSILVDAGDATQGASFATITKGADVIRVMNEAGYDVMAAGNHEFDYGTQQLLSNSKIADFPIISANVLLNGSQMLKENAVITSGGRKIGFIGLTTVDTATSTNPTQLDGVMFVDEIETAKKQIAELKDETDAIILICHMGNDASAVDCTVTKMLDALTDEELSQITAVVDGHSHTLENYVYEGTSIPIIQTGTGFNALGKITLDFYEDDSISASGDIISFEEAMSYELSEEGKAAAKAVSDTLAEIKSEQEPMLGEILCTNETPLWGGYIYWDYAESRIVETNYGDFVTDAFASFAKTFADGNNLDMPVIAVENGGGISATLPCGKVTRGDILNAFNHGNMIQVIKITPAQLYDALESGLVITGQDETGLLIRERVSGSFLQVSGFSYTYDPVKESGKKVVSVVLDNGTALSRDDTSTGLLLATNNYVASFDAFSASEKLGELGGEDYIVESYILEITKNGKNSLSVPVTAQRIGIAGDNSPDTYEVFVPIIDDSESADIDNRIVHVRIDSGEYSEYVTDASGRINLKLEKGPHTLYLEESADGQPVYVNNYSGSGTVTVKDGYYRLGFIVDSSELAEAVEEKPTQSGEDQKPDKEEGDNKKPDSTGKNPSNAPDTGDNDIGSLTIILILSATGLLAAASVCKRKKSRHG